MLKNEAAWLERELARLSVDALSPLLSIGSGTSETRRGRQPWIAERLFDPLERRGVHVVHHEHRAGPGVDVTGDLADSDFLASLRGARCSKRPLRATCSNTSPTRSRRLRRWRQSWRPEAT